MIYRSMALFAMILFPLTASAQFDEDQVGAWYMYFWTLAPNDRGFGFQGDIQHRNWDTAGDLEQGLIRGGLTWNPEGSAIKYTLGAAWIASGQYGTSNAKTYERRLYQEVVVPHRTGEKAYFSHRFRFEQRDLDAQDLRTRIRYFLGLNYPLNQETLTRGAFYLAFYNELFLNLNRSIGDGRRVDYFDRNRAYAGFGHSLTESTRLQLGYMRQDLNNAAKEQLQFSLIQSF